MLIIYGCGVAVEWWLMMVVPYDDAVVTVMMVITNSDGCIIVTGSQHIMALKIERTFK